MTEFTVLVEEDEQGILVGTVAELPGCHTQAPSLDQLMERIREAIQLYLEADGPRREGRFRGVQRIEVEA